LPVSFISCAFERADNLGAYRIPPETGLLIPSVLYKGIAEVKGFLLPGFGDSCASPNLEFCYLSAHFVLP
jgi:hypothetical protein